VEEKKQKVETAKAELKIHKRFILSPLLIVAIIIGVILIAGGVLFLRSKQGNNVAVKTSIKSALENSDKKDLRRAIVAVIDPAKDSSIDVVTDKKVVINLEFPKGVFKQTHKLAIVPYSSSDPANPVKLLIYPQNLSFRKPVTVTFDLSRSPFRTDGPEFIGSNGRVTGNSQVLFTDKVTSHPIPALISRSTETSRIVTARILGTGLYSLTTNGGQKVEYARAALSSRNSDILTILESASVLVFNNEKLSAKEKNIAFKAISSIKSKPKSSAYDMYPAFALSHEFAGKKTSFRFVTQVEAAGDPCEDYLKFSCGDSKNANNPAILAVLANTAKLGGYADVEKKCMDHARTLIAEKNRELLSGNPTRAQLLAQMRENQSFQMPDSANAALQTRVDKILTKELQDLVNQGATKEALAQKLIEVQALGNVSEKITDIVEDRIAQKAYEDAKKVAIDPKSTPDQIKEALRVAQLFNIRPDENDEITQDIINRLNRTPQQILDSPDSTWGEILKAYEQTEGDPELHAKLLERKNAERNKHITPLSTRPPVSDAPTQAVELAEQGYDPNIMVVPVFLMMGGESFDEKGIKKFSQEFADNANEMLDGVKNACPDAIALAEEFGVPPGFSLADLKAKCADATGGKIDQMIVDGKRDLDAFAGDVSEGQRNYESFSDDESDWHIEIEITPTPGGEMESEQPIDDWGGWTAEDSEDSTYEELGIENYPIDEEEVTGTQEQGLQYETTTDSEQAQSENEAHKEETEVHE